MLRKGNHLKASLHHGSIEATLVVADNAET
jgi:hypothetical protein